MHVSIIPYTQSVPQVPKLQTNIVIVAISCCFTDRSGGGDVSVDLFQAKLLARDGQYSVKRTGMEDQSLGLLTPVLGLNTTDDPVYAAVLGGCSLANVSNFKELNKTLLFDDDPTNYHDDPTEFFHEVYEEECFFYNKNLYWFFCLNAGSKDYKVEVSLPVQIISNYNAALVTVLWSSQQEPLVVTLMLILCTSIIWILFTQHTWLVILTKCL